ncbi:MAG TPA: tetratricopeptide repeat protein, partial [Pyrinomonadaceae bacterium]|nr:tetratricopeptide repeat protein [Pyrinomonadaceae bacterium]
MTQPSIFSRLAAIALLPAVAYAALIAQDISGGAGVLLASADVEAKLGKGIFTPAQNKTHAVKTLEKKTVARSVRAAHATRQTTANNRETNTNTNTSGNNSSGNNNRSTNNNVSGGPLGGPARRVGGSLDAEAFNKQGDDFFDAGQFDKAAASYQKAIKERPDYEDAYVNLSEAYYNLGRYDDAINTAQQAIKLKPDYGDAYRALGTAYLKTSRSSEALGALKKAHDLDPNDAE